MPATVQQVEERIRKRRGPDEARLRVFAEGFFGNADPALLDRFDTDSLLAMAQSALGFLDRSLAQAPIAVDVQDPRYDSDGWEAPHTIVRLALGDRPFIVDTVRSHLRAAGLTIDHVLHPTFLAERDPTGRLQRLSPRRSDAPGRGEALELWFIERLDDPERRAALQRDLTAALRDLILVTDDFAAMLERTRALADLLRAAPAVAASRGDAASDDAASDDPIARAEHADFLDYLADGRFLFLAQRFEPLDPNDALTPLGLARSDRDPFTPHPAATSAHRFAIGKSRTRSPVARAARMDEVIIDVAGVGTHRLLGLLNTRAYADPPEAVPILRRRLEAVLAVDGAVPGSHDHKQIVATFATLPRVDLFTAEAAAVQREIRSIMHLDQAVGVRLLLRPDPLGRGLGVTVRLPRDRFSADVRRRVQAYLVRELAASHVDYQLALGEDEGRARLHFFFDTDRRLGDVDASALERAVGEITRSWDDLLRARLVHAHGEREGRRRADRYEGAFDARYQADNAASTAQRDIDHAEALTPHGVRVDLLHAQHEPRGSGATQVRIYRYGDALALSDVLPILENLGFRVREQTSYLLRRADATLSIDVFHVHDHHGQPIDVRADGARLIEAAEAVLRGEAEHDRLGRLVLHGGLRLREVALLRAVQMHYVQLDAVTSRAFVTDTLIAHPRAAAALFARFAARFDPAIDPASRPQREADADAAFHDTLADVATLPEDQVLRALADLIRAMVRCDYYRNEAWIAFKIDSAKVAVMPEPRPMAEIGVAAPHVEGVHLRGGRVARGGIRASDRPDDFRTEVLGLMKTQMTKNAVIVPVGSKGGFVVKRPPADRDAARAFLLAQYQIYVRALLGLTDDVVAGEIVPPAGLVIHDAPDPYLVVAADKGTASFSDAANAIAAERGFWLGDAFASGGSAGYDHKGVGITARGAWAAITRHFRDLGLDPLRDPFTAVGIGDMSGDVFGNGLLATRTIRLVAAFDHRHVFVDPTPDPERSFAERARLFALPRSSWADYDPEAISPGGGVYPRGAKRIELSPAACRALGIDAATLSGQDLVRAVLRAPVDLLWNGGIGTYVKASSERHADVADATNDAVRVDAAALRVRIVGEGGNLGFTQAARIEYARAGGRIHTDAIDNVGGVDLSDHEVNLKLAFGPLLASGELTRVQRDRLLHDMTSDVADAVLRDAAYQALALALAERRSRGDVALFGSLIESLAERGAVDPAAALLPDRRAIAERARANAPLTKPELAVVMAHVKLDLKQTLLATDLPDAEDFWPDYLAGYFPPALARFPDAIRSHPLRREIVATTVCNRIVDLLGPTFVHRSIRDSAATPLEVVRAALIALDTLGVAELERAIADHAPPEADLPAYEALVEAVEGVVRHLLLDDLSSAPARAFIDGYRSPLIDIRRALAGLLPAAPRRALAADVRRWVRSGFPDAVARDLAAVSYLPSAMAVVEVAQRTGIDPLRVGKDFFAIGERLRLPWLRHRLTALPATDPWTKIAVAGLVMDLRQAQRDLTQRFLTAPARASLEAFLARTPHALRRYDEAIARIERDDDLTLASASVLVRLLGQAR
jgi:glutamate dehydrogenase